MKITISKSINFFGSTIATLLLTFNLASAENKLRHFQVYESPEAGLIVYKPGSPEWNIDLDERTGTDAIILSTPDNYFPPTSIEIRINQVYAIQSQDLSEIAMVVTNILREKSGADILPSNTMQQIEYGNVEALKDQFNVTFENHEYTIRHIVGRMPSGHVVTMMATTPKDQIDAIEFMLSKIYSNLKEI